MIPEFDPGSLNKSGKDADGVERNCLLAWIKGDGKSAKTALLEVVKYLLWCVENSSGISVAEANRISEKNSCKSLGGALIGALKSSCIFPSWEKQGLSLITFPGSVGQSYTPSNTAQFRLWCTNLLKEVERL